MAIIKNEREKKLQATVPRFSSTSIVITPSTNSFKKPKNGEAITSGGIVTSQITFTSTTNIFTSPTFAWSYKASNGSWVVISGATSSSYILTSTNFISFLGTGQYVSFKCIATQANFTTATSSIVDITYNIESDDTILVEQTMPVATVGADATGVANEFTTTNNSITVKRGGVNLAYGTGNNQFTVAYASQTPVSGTGTVTVPIGSGAVNTFTIGVFSAMSTTLITATIFYTVSIKDLSGVVTNQTLAQTVRKVNAGVGGLTGYLTNENHTVAANYLGSGFSLTAAGGNFILYNGIIDVSSLCTFSITGGVDGGASWTKAQNLLTLTINETTGVYSLSGASWNTTAESFTVTATYLGTTISKVYTISKAVAGVVGGDGVDASTVYLTTTAQGFTYNSSGTTPSPASVTLTAVGTMPTGTKYYEFVKDGISQQNSTTTTYLYTPQASYTNMPDSILVNLRNGGTNGTIMATDTITMVGMRPGADSTVAGPSGATAVFAYRLYYSTTGMPSAATVGVASGAPTSGAAVGNTSNSTGWYTTPPSTVSANYWLFQCSGTLLSGSYTWISPCYLSTFKVGTLSALSANMGAIQIDTTGKVYAGKTTYATAAAGFFLGYDTSAYKFKVGNSADTASLGWDGTVLTIKGNISGTSTIDITGSANFNGSSSITTLLGAGTTIAMRANSTNTTDVGVYASSHDPATTGTVAVMGVSTAGSTGSAYGGYFAGTTGIYGLSNIDGLGTSIGIWGKSTVNVADSIGIFCDTSGLSLAYPLAISYGRTGTPTNTSTPNGWTPVLINSTTSYIPYYR